jgi:hypothetical protein
VGGRPAPPQPGYCAAIVTDRLFDVLPRTAPAGPDGRLTVGGCARADAAEAFGTPAFVVD